MLNRIDSAALAPRAIQKYLEDPLAEYILAHPVKENSTLELTVENDEVTIHELENEQ